MELLTDKQMRNRTKSLIAHAINQAETVRDCCDFTTQCMVAIRHCVEGMMRLSPEGKQHHELDAHWKWLNAYFLKLSTALLSVAKMEHVPLEWLLHVN